MDIKNFKLSKWSPPKSNPNWSHDHCEICHIEISNLKTAENEGYTNKDGGEGDWICKKCFNKLLENKK